MTTDLHGVYQKIRQLEESLNTEQRRNYYQIDKLIADIYINLEAYNFQQDRDLNAKFAKLILQNLKQIQPGASSPESQSQKAEYIKNLTRYVKDADFELSYDLPAEAEKIVAQHLAAAPVLRMPRVQAHAQPRDEVKVSSLGTTDLINLATQAAGGRPDIKVSPPRSDFYFMMVNTNAPNAPELSLKSRFKEHTSSLEGHATELLRRDRQHGRQMVSNDYSREAGFIRPGSSMPHQTNDASFKLHISINDIKNKLNDEQLKGLFSLLISESQDSKDMRFNFKLAKREILEGTRFENNDQFTLYFDKYSSVGKMMELTEKTNKYLADCGIQQASPLGGGKDVIDFGSFVSGRFETLKLVDLYAEHELIDQQLKIFFDKYKDNPQALDSVPVCILEQVVHDSILNSRNTQQKLDEGLFVKEIHANLAEAVENPKQYFDKPRHVVEKNIENSRDLQQAMVEYFKLVSSPVIRGTAAVEENPKKAQQLGIKIQEAVRNGIQIPDREKHEISTTIKLLELEQSPWNVQNPVIRSRSIEKSNSPSSDHAAEKTNQHKPKQ